MENVADTLTIRFRGVRGSHPVPGPDTLRYGGNTACQEIRAGNRLLILDAGTGIISLGADLMTGLGSDNRPDTMAVFLSHYHHDHIDGLLYFKPAYRNDVRMHIYGPAETPGCDILGVLERVSSPAAHPVRFTRMGMRYTTDCIAGGDVVVWRAGKPAPEILADGEDPGPDDVTVRVMKNPLHPIGGVLNFRIEHKGKSYVYATDVEGDEKTGDPALAGFARDADLLAHDGQYTSGEYAAFRKGWGHSTIAMAMKTAELARAKQLVVIHHDPASSDEQLDAMEAEARQRFPHMFFAREGQEITL